jgi:cephalosporin-C deacetylase-like acetyl esterase
MDKKRIDSFAEEVYRAGAIPCKVNIEKIDPFEPYIYPFHVITQNRYVQFEPPKRSPFYGYFQPCFNKAAPLLIHTPGYGGEMSIHPELTDSFCVLHVNPLGYVTPSGKDKNKMTMDGLGSVFIDTILSEGRGGYFDWLSDCVTAIEWARNQPEVLKDRLTFFGTSQGGGAALLLGSIYSGKGTKCAAADQPFLTDFALANELGAYSMGKNLYAHLSRQKALDALYNFDTINHVHRYNFPVLLTSGGRDVVCSPDTIQSLFSKLNGTRLYVHFEHLEHGYNKEFISLAKAWFNIYS